MVPAGQVEARRRRAVEQIGRTINVQTVFLGIIAGLLVLYTFYLARTVIAIPLVLACMFNLVLTPVVLALARARYSGAGRRWAGGVRRSCSCSALAYRPLAEPAAEWLRRLPLSSTS